MIKNIVFDMGGVLIDWSPREIIGRYGLSDEESSLLFLEVFCGREWTAMDHGTMTPEEGLSLICRRLPQSLHAAAASCVLDWWKSPLIPMAGMEPLIRELKANNYGIWLLSNATSALHEYFPRIPGSDCFSGLLVSADVRLLKPHHEIYRRLFETFSLKPEECFFIDDNPLNIDGCYDVGMPGTVFLRDTDRLRRELREAGIRISASTERLH